MEQNHETNTPPKKRRRKRRRSGCASALLYFLLVIGLSAVLSIVAVFAANDVFAFIKSDKELSISVDEKTPIADLGGTLDDRGIVNYGFLFDLFASITQRDNETGAVDEVLVGTYTLNPSMDYQQICRTLLRREQSKTTVQVTIPEGYTAAQIKALLVEKSVCTAEDLDEYLNEYDYKHDFLQDRKPAHNGWLEGYLFPDTYEFYQNHNAKMTLNTLLNTFKIRYDEPIQQGAASLGYSQHEIVTIASMVEREAKREEEFARIAGVIYNRLKSSQFKRLEIDATLQYALGQHKEVLSEEDKNIDSPYNTYKVEGLPPGPICNPGYTALYAATHPEKHNYYFYVAMPDGSHLFANSYDEHLSNIEKAKRAAAEAEKAGEAQ